MNHAARLGERLRGDFVRVRRAARLGERLRGDFARVKFAARLEERLRGDCMNGGNVMTLQEIIDDSKRIVFFGGAGVSTESGIPDFRSADGLYNQKYKFPPETIVSHSFFGRNTGEFFRFYRDRMVFPEAKPNAAHKKLAEWEQRGILSAVITQNIDGLHQLAGSKNVVELHGSIHRNYCMKCKKSYPLSKVIEADGVPRCECGGIIKPDVVLYEESLKAEDMEKAVREISAADTLIVGGTSLMVYPAALFLREFNGKHLVVINKSEINVKNAELVIFDSIGKVLGELN